MVNKIKLPCLLFNVNQMCNWSNIGTDIGLLPDGTKSLPYQVLTKIPWNLRLATFSDTAPSVSVIIYVNQHRFSKWKRYIVTGCYNYWHTTKLNEMYRFCHNFARCDSQQNRATLAEKLRKSIQNGGSWPYFAWFSKSSNHRDGLHSANSSIKLSGHHSTQT